MESSVLKMSLSQIDSSIHTRKDTLMILPEGSDRYLDILEELGELYVSRFHHAPHLPADLDEAIDLLREFCRICPASNRQLLALYKFSGLLEERCCPEMLLQGFIYSGSGKIPEKSNDLDESIIIQEKALLICPKEHELYKCLLGRLGSTLLVRQGSFIDFQKSARLLKSSLELYSSGHDNRFPLLLNLSRVLRMMVAAVDPSSTQPEVEQLINISKEITDQYLGRPDSPKTSAELLIESGDWLVHLCQPPLNCSWRANEIYHIAEELLKLGEVKESQQFTVKAEVLQDPQPFSFHVAQYPKPNYKYHLSLMDTREYNDHSSIKAVYDQSTLVQPTESLQSNMILMQIKQNLVHLADSQNNQEDILTIHLNLSTLYQRLDSMERNSQYLTVAIEYQKAALQIIDPYHYFYGNLLTQSYGCLQALYSFSNDPSDYRDMYRISLQTAPEQGVVIGPSLMGNPWEQPVKTFRIMPSAESTSLSAIEMARKFVADRKTLKDQCDLAEALYAHCRRFYPKDTIYLEEISQIMFQVRSIDPPWKFYRGLNIATLNIAWYRYSGDISHLEKALQEEPNETFHIEALYEKYHHTGNISYLDLAISHSQASKIKDLKNPHLGMCLNRRYQATGNLNDLHKCLQLGNLADQSEAYLYLYQRFGQEEDLSQAFKVVDPSTLDVKEDPGYDTLRRCIVYCEVQVEKYMLMHDTDLLVSAKFVVQNSRIYCPQSLHPQFLHLEALVSTAEIIGADSCNIQDILSAISVEETALKLVPKKSVYRPSFMSLLGVLFYEKFSVTQDTADLKSSIQMIKESIALLLSTSPHLPLYQLELGKALQLYARKLNLPKLLLEAIHILKTAATSKLASFKFQYIAGIKWAEACEERNDPETLAAYEFILDVLPKIGSLGLDIQKRHQTLVSMPSGIAGNAAAYAIQCGLIEKAVEFLEHGRFIFWQKAAQLRAPLAELENSRPELARRLKIVTRDLNISGFRMLVDEDSKAYSDFISRESYKRQALSDEWEQLLSEINTIPGYEDFLMARPYSQLCKAATGRIIAILTVTEKSCHAIILRSATSSAVAVPLLSMTKAYAEKLAAMLEFTLRTGNRQSREVPKQNRAGRPSIPFKEMMEEKRMLHILSELWIHVVKPVFDFLELEQSNTPPNMTWCCSDILSLLPIHAAGIYSGVILENTSDFVISSYIPSLSSLLTPSQISIKEGKILLACLQDAPGLPPLPNVLLELQVVKDTFSVNAPNTTCVSLEDSKATCNTVLENMTMAHIVHLACHGTSMDNPLESSIILYDGSLKVDKLMRTPFPNARLVFLSACQTAQINPSEPDEYIHIAAAMLFAGFESVIGTMWSINDGDAPIVAKSFYQNLIKDGKIQFSNTSLALHNAIKDLRESGTSPLQWVPFVHIGM